MRELQSLNIDLTVEKEKQKAEVKHILQQKQRALSDLFKMLAAIGQPLPPGPSASQCFRSSTLFWSFQACRTAKA